MLYSLQEVIKFDDTKAKDFFIKSYKKYNHLGENIKFELVKVDLDKIIQEDTAEKNEGSHLSTQPIYLFYEDQLQTLTDILYIFPYDCMFLGQSFSR